jgi:hypothetical protein
MTADYLPSCPTSLNLEIKNIRKYNLKNVVLSRGDKSFNLGDFVPGETKKQSLDFGSWSTKDLPLDFHFTYTTHSGLDAVSLVKFYPPCSSDNPLILNPDFIKKTVSATEISGRLIQSAKLNVILPESWKQFSFNGQTKTKEKARQILILENPYHVVSDFEFSRDNRTWSKFISGQALDGGLYYFRFRWPNIDSASQYLVLEGSGGEQVTFYLPSGARNFPTHSYRENVLKGSDLDNPKFGESLVFSINRTSTKYADMDSALRNFPVPLTLKTDVVVDFQVPKIFAPLNIEIKKID